MHIYTLLYSFISFVLSRFSLHQVFLVYLIAIITMHFTYVMFLTYTVAFTFFMLLLVLSHIQSLSVFALCFIHWHAYSSSMYAANYSNCTVLFGLYIKHGLIYQSQVMAVILNEIVDIFAHNLLCLSRCWCNKHCVAVDEGNFLQSLLGPFLPNCHFPKRPDYYSCVQRL